MYKKALITGASSGIGEIFADKLASQGINLIITARREKLLHELKNRLESKYGVEIIVIISDLSNENDINRLCELIRSENIDYLINNAGFANVGDFHNINIEKHRKMLMVHVNATIELIHAILPSMISNNSGVIINVASIAGLLKKSPTGLYGPTKALLISLSQTLNNMLSNTDIIIQALCPGYTYSGFHKTEEYRSNNKDIYHSVPKYFWMSSESVVDYSLKKLKKNKVIVIPGIKNRIAVKLINFGFFKR